MTQIEKTRRMPNRLLLKETYIRQNRDSQKRYTKDTKLNKERDPQKRPTKETHKRHKMTQTDTPGGCNRLLPKETYRTHKRDQQKRPTNETYTRPKTDTHRQVSRTGSESDTKPLNHIP